MTIIFNACFLVEVFDDLAINNLLMRPNKMS